MKIIIWCFSLTVLVYALFSVARIIQNTAPDFSVYYGAARYLVRGQPLYRGTGLYTGVGYPPESLVPFVPLTLLPYGAAQALWIIASFLALIVSAYLSLAVAGIKPTPLNVAAVSAAAFLMFPVKFTLGMGQSNLVALALLQAGLRQIKTGTNIRGPILIGLATVLKPHLLLILPGLLLAGQAYTVAGAAAVHGILALLTMVIYGTGNFVTYVSESVPFMSGFRGWEIYYNQGIRAMVSRLAPDQYAPVIIMTLSVGIGIASLWIILKRGFDAVRALLLLLPVLLLTEPLSWQHHYVFLLPVFVYLLPRIRSSSEAAALAAAYILIGMNLDQAGSIDRSLVSGLVQSHVGIGNIILLWLFIRTS